MRWELLDQAASDLRRRYPDFINKIGRVGGPQHLPQLSEIRNNTQLVYTTIHTWKARHEKISLLNQFDYVIIDEVHWGEGQPMFNKLIQHHQNRSVFIGLTATPHKNSKFQAICSNFDFHNLVSMNYLAKPIPDPKPTGVQWNPQRYGQKGDFCSDSLNELAINSKRNQLIVDTYKQNIEL